MLLSSGLQAPWRDLAGLVSVAPGTDFSSFPISLSPVPHSCSLVSLPPNKWLTESLVSLNCVYLLGSVQAETVGTRSGLSPASKPSERDSGTESTKPLLPVVKWGRRGRWGLQRCDHQDSHQWQFCMRCRLAYAMAVAHEQYGAMQLWGLSKELALVNTSRWLKKEKRKRQVQVSHPSTVGVRRPLWQYEYLEIFIFCRHRIDC